MSLLQMSFAGAVMILVIIVVRALLINKLPKKTFLVLWGIVLARLLLPFSLPSVFSIYSLLGQNAPVMDAVKNTPAIRLLPIAPVWQGEALIASSPELIRSVSVWNIVWAVGVLVGAVFFAVAYWKCRREFQTSLPVENDFTKSWLNGHRLKRLISIRQSSRFSSPLTYGVFRPVILIPKSTKWEDTAALQYVLAHEYVHIRRFDAVTKLVLIAALCVHWFNPLVWAMYVLANRDLELSCDEAVVRLFGERAKSAYARALISMEETRSGLTPLCNNFSKNAIEERITAIMKTKKATVLSLILACFLVVGTTTAFATSAHTTANDKTGNENTGTIIEDGTMLSILDENGKIRYSTDGGQTFLSEEDLNKQYPPMDIEWWTYEEYKAWLENEKVVLQSMLGEKAYTGGRGEFIWTQAIIDETIAMYEKNLRDIKNGLRVSKSVDGSDDDMVSYYPDENAVVGKAEGVAIVFDNGEKVTFGPYDTTTGLLAEVKLYCEQQVQLGNMTQDEANKILEKYAS